MKRIILAASALSLALVAAPAFAAGSPASVAVPVTGTVAGACGVGNQSGGGTGGGETVAFGALTDGNGFLNAAPKEITFGNLWCNGAAGYDIDVSALSTNVVVLDTGSFTNTLDLTLSGKIVDTYFGSGSVKTGDVKIGNIGAAFETGTGQYSKGTIAVSLPANSTPSDRPVAGAYTGSVTITLTPTA